MNRRCHSLVRRFRAARFCTVLLLLTTGGCNLGFDASQFEPLEPEPEPEVAPVGEPDIPDELPPGCEDLDGDSFGRGEDCPKDENDCDDTRSVVFPGAPEVCDNLDNDCDSKIDEGADDTPLTMSCYTGEIEAELLPGAACREGTMVCEDGQFPSPVTPSDCRGQILPSAPGELNLPERCDGIDNDCDGVVDPQCECPRAMAIEPCYEQSPPNARGRGICVEGVHECFELDNGNRIWGECQDDVAPGEETCGNMGSDDNCDGIDDNIEQLGEACDTGRPGRCIPGTWQCEGDNLVCVSNLDPVAEICDTIDQDCDGETNNGVDNACGGCDALPGTPGFSCGDCSDGTWECQEDGTLLCAGDSARNLCGGCVELERDPGDQCGNCGFFICNGEDRTRCEDPGFNQCGGCGDVSGGELLGTRCNECGEYVCSGENNIRCEDEPFNACGSCDVLIGEPGESCGQCGEYQCEGDTGQVACDDPGFNQCGGCAPLSNNIGESCGSCGIWQCDGEEALRCDDPGLNSCGGCGTLSGEPGGDCGACGTWECSGDNSAVLCNDPGANACGGCGEIVGTPLGTECGTCGTFVCDGGNSTICEDPGLNSCLACGNITEVPGSTCNGGCGVYTCNDNGLLTCNTLRCPDLPGVVRFLHLMQGGPTIDVRIDNILPVTGNSFEEDSDYLNIPGSSSFFEIFEETSPPFIGESFHSFQYEIDDGVQQTMVFIGEADGDYGGDNFFLFTDDNIPVENRAKVRWGNLVPDIVGGAAIEVEVTGPGHEREVLFDNVSYASVSDYAVFEPGFYRLEVFVEGNPRVSLGFFDRIPLRAGDVLTLFYYGTVANGLLLRTGPQELDIPLFPPP